MIAVVGTGVVGACIGYYLARDEAEVMLVDAGEPGALTTSSSLAWVNASSKSGRGAYFDLNFAGLTEYEQLASSLGGTWWNPTGHLRWDYEDESELVKHVEQVHERGYPAEVWEAEQVQRLLEPAVAFRSPSASVAFFPSEGWVDGPALVRELVAGAVQQGAIAAFGNGVRRIGVTDGAVSSIELASGETHPVTAVVNAAGPEAAAIASLVGRALPMKNRPGLAVRVQIGEHRVGRVIHPPQIAIRPDGPGRAFLLARGVEEALIEELDTPLALAEVAKQLASRAIPELADADVIDARVGRRPIPGDGLPAIGKATAIEGYYEAVTHSGITLGPILGRALTAEILRGEIDPLVERFRADRL